jgi:two-component system NarL family sensor kinase
MDIANGLKYYIFAVHILEKLPNDNTTFITKIHQNMAILYEQNRDYKKALEYNKKSIAIFLKNKDTLNLAGVYPNLGSTYYKIKNYSKAIETYKKALYFAKRSKRISSISSINVGLGLVYQDLKQYDIALKHHQEAFKIAKQNGLKEYMSSSLSNIGVDYHGLKQYELALKYLQESQELAKELENLYLIKTNYLCISEVYESMNLDAKALEALKKSTEANDSMFNDNNAKKINELTIKYETEKKEKKIAVLHADNLEKQKDKIILKNHLEKKNSLIIGLIVSAILLIITTTLLYNRRRLILKNQHQKEINYQREKSTKAIVQAQEKEQTRIAKELHDSVGSYLSTLKINLQLYENDVPQNKQQDFFQSLKLIDKISNELRNIMRNLSNETLNEHGLDNALREIILEINALGLTKMEYQNVGLITRLDENIEHNLYRISQELVTNCIKHAKATFALLQLIENEKGITLMFEDNGIGFSENQSEYSEDDNIGMGLKNIQNRVEFLEGKIHIDTSSKHGTTFIIEIPKK